MKRAGELWRKAEMRGMKRMKGVIAAIAVLAIFALTPLAVLAVHTSSVINTADNPPVTASTSESFTLAVTNESGDKMTKVELWVDTTSTGWTSVLATDPSAWSHTVVDNLITWTSPAGLKAGNTEYFGWSATTGSAGTSYHDWQTTDFKDGVYPSTPGQFTIEVGAVPEFIHGLLIPLAMAITIYFLMRARAKRRGQLR